MKILLLKFRNIGDVLLITPLISNLNAYYPDAQIDVAVNKGTESMLSLNPNINKMIIFDSWTKRFNRPIFKISWWHNI